MSLLDLKEELRKQVDDVHNKSSNNYAKDFAFLMNDYKFASIEQHIILEYIINDCGWGFANMIIDEYNFYFRHNNFEKLKHVVLKMDTHNAWERYKKNSKLLCEMR